MNSRQSTFLYGVAAGAVLLSILQNTKITLGGSKLNLNRSVNGQVGKIIYSRSGAYYRCIDGAYTNSLEPGRCSYHEGVMPGGMKKTAKVRQLRMF